MADEPRPAILPQEDMQGPTSKQKAAAAIAAACLVCAPLTAMFEGFASKVYRDPVGVPTYCYGETHNVSKDPLRIYAKTECMALLRKRMANDYAPQILNCVPGLIEPNRRNEFAALIDTSYNAGAKGVCRSSVARAFNAGQFKLGCERLKSFYTGSVTKQRINKNSRQITTGPNKGKWFTAFSGLVSRRATFAKLCLEPEK